MKDPCTRRLGLGLLTAPATLRISSSFGFSSHCICRFLSLPLRLFPQAFFVVKLQRREAVRPQALFLRLGRLQNIGHKPVLACRVVIPNLLQELVVLRIWHSFLLLTASNVTLSFGGTLDGFDIS